MVRASQSEFRVAIFCPGGTAAQEWREDKVRMGMVLARRGLLGFSPV
jgi:hypothetical protein